MELDGLATCLAQSKPGDGSQHDLTWLQIERLLRLCPNCQFKSINKIPAIRQLRQALNKQQQQQQTRKFDRLYPPQDQLLDIKPETIYHFDELEQRAVLSLCKYLCVSGGNYIHKLLPLLLRYLATLHLAKWPPHYFKNVFLMKYHQRHDQQLQLKQLEKDKQNKDINHIDITTDKKDNHIDNNDNKIDNKIVDNDNDNKKDNLNAIQEEPTTKTTHPQVPTNLKTASSLTTDRSASVDNISMQAATPKSDGVAIVYNDDIPDEEKDDVKDIVVSNNNNSSNNNNNMDDLMKYMDNPLHSPLCQFVMEFIYHIGDISHSVEESSVIIRRGIIIVLTAYIKILRKENDDVDRDDFDNIRYQSINLNPDNQSSSFYVIIPIIWGILNAIKEEQCINIDKKFAKDISKCIDTLSKYNKNSTFSTLWKSEWDILSTGVRASLLAYFLPSNGPIEKAPKKVFATPIIRELFNKSMDIIGVKKSPSSIEVREQHMRLATLCSIYEKSLRKKLEKTIREILTFHISKYIKSNHSHISTVRTSPNSNINKKNNKNDKNNNRHIKYRMGDQTILINACCLVLEQLAERAPTQLQEISYYFQRLLIDRNSIYLGDEEINERLMDALAVVCQSELKYMEYIEQKEKEFELIIANKHNKDKDNDNDQSPKHKPLVNYINDDMFEEKKELLFDNDIKNDNNNKDNKLDNDIKDDNKDNDNDNNINNITTTLKRKISHHKKASSLTLAFRHNKHWYDDSSTRTVFNELENNFNDSINEDSKLINRALRIYGAMMVKVNHRLITKQFLNSSLKSRLTQKLTVILPYLIDTAINQQSTEIQFVKEIILLLIQSYLTKSNKSYQLDTKRKIAEAFTELSTNLTRYSLREYLLNELLKMFSAISKEILNNHLKKKLPLTLISNELGLMLPSIAILCTPLYDDCDEDEKKLSYFGNNEYYADQYGITLMNNHNNTVSLFREFWNLIIFFDFTSSTNNFYKIYLQTIALSTPILVSGSATLFAGGLIHEVFKHKTNSLSINKRIFSLKTNLQNIIKKQSNTKKGGNDDVDNNNNNIINISVLSPDAILFLNVIYFVELFRISNYSGTAYSLVHYLNDAGVIRQDLSLYLELVVDYVFDRYLQHMYRSKASLNKLILLESHTEYLLSMCCSRSSSIRNKSYIWLQHKLIATYNYLQWRPKCLSVILNLVSKLETLIDDVSTELYKYNDKHSTIKYNNKYILDLPEDRISRAEIRSITLDISSQWLHNSWTLAPSEMISIIAHKLSQYKSPLLSSLMYSQCKYPLYNNNNYMLSSYTKPKMGLMFVVSNCEKYLGLIEGLYKTHLLQSPTLAAKSFGMLKSQIFINTFKRYILMQSKVKKNTLNWKNLEQGMVEEMYQVSALIVWAYNKKQSILSNNKLLAHHFKLQIEDLLSLLCMVPSIIFSIDIITTGTFVWRWIMTTSPDLQESLIRNMKPSWNFIIEQKKGIFANKHVKPNEIESHNIWISWLLESIENIIESSPESVENIATMMIDGLAAIAKNPQHTHELESERTVKNKQSTAKKQQKQKQAAPIKKRPKLPATKAPTINRNKNIFKRKNSKAQISLASSSNTDIIVKQQKKVQIRDNNNNNNKNNKDNTKDKDKDLGGNIHKFDTYIATFGATLRFYNAIARILNTLRSASVPLLSKTIATILRGRLYSGVLQLFECKIVWRYPSSWTDIWQNANAIIELFQFFMTEHRQVTKRHINLLKQTKRNNYNTNKHHIQQTSISGITANNNTIYDQYVPNPPTVNIDNYRSKINPSHMHKPPNILIKDNNSSSSNHQSSSHNRQSLTTTMPYLNDNSLIRSPAVVNNKYPFGHHRASSMHRNLQRGMGTMGSLRQRGTPFITTSKTQRAPSIRRNSFGHNKHASLDLNKLFGDKSDNNDNKSSILIDNQRGMMSPFTPPTITPKHKSITSIGSTILMEENIMNINGRSRTNSSLINQSSNLNNNINNKYLYKLDFDDVYYWEGNNAFIQDSMTSWLHQHRGWCQMICCVFLADELERLCAWYNTRDSDNVNNISSSSNTNIVDYDHHHMHPNRNNISLTDIEENNAQNNKRNKKIDDRIKKFPFQEELIKYINNIGQSQWSALVDTTWSFSALLSVRFYQRFKYKDYNIISTSSPNSPLGINKTICETLTNHIHFEPKSIQNIPDVVNLLITESTVKQDSIELEELCVFKSAPLYKCLQLLKQTFLTHSIVNQYLFRSLRNESQIDMEGIIFVIPQLIQALRFDPSGLLRTFLLDCAYNDLTMAHQLIWLSDCESFEGEDMYSRNQTNNNNINNDYSNNSMHSLHSLNNDNNNPHHLIVDDDDDNDFCKFMRKLSSDIKLQFNSRVKLRNFYSSEFKFFDAVNSASVDINASTHSKKEKKKLIKAELIRIRSSMYKYTNKGNKLYMPTNPQWEIVDIIPDSVIALQSAAKVPFLVNFKIIKHNDDIPHIINGSSSSSSNNNKIEIQKCIFKTHDDCGQDALALQIIEYFKHIFREAGLPLLLFPYRVIATRSGRDKVVGGMIECVQNARSRSDLGNENNYRLRRHFIETYGSVESSSFRKAQRNFILSLAGYAVVCYLLQIKDRHNANIMINKYGHLIHIDFGFLFDISPGKNIGFETAGFKINDEMVELIGDDGSHTTPLFLWFVELCIRGYLVCREHMDEIISIIQLSSNSNLPCFLPQTMQNLRNRFVPEKSTTDAAQHMKARVIHACSTWTTNAYDEFQKRSQGIWKAPKRDDDN